MRPPLRRAAAGALAGLLAALLGVTGCGVPTSSDVQHVGPGPEAGSTLLTDGRPPPLPDAAGTASEQVENFLQAAAGSPATAADRVREYLRGSDRATWQPDEGIRVVRLLRDPFINDDVDGGWVVELKVQLVGELHPNGYLDAPTTVEPVDYSFRVVTEGGPDTGVNGQALRLRIADPPPYLLLEDTALANRNYYYPNPIYFWDGDHEQLVPDLRWLPLAGEPAEQHPWTVVQWLQTGPAPGLPRIEGLPAGTQHQGAPVWEGDRLVVNFNAAAVEGQSIDDLATQLSWSLGSLLELRDGAELELRIDDRPQEARPRSPEPGSNPVRYAVLEGAVHRYGADQASPPLALAGDINNGIRAAALTADGEAAALVRERADGQQQLTVAVAAGADPTEATTDLVAEQIGQPIWLGDQRGAAGLAIAGGELHRFTSDGNVDPVPVSALAGEITAVAMAPERRRLALIAGDRLYVAQLRFDSESVTVQAPRPLPTTVRDLAGVAFSHENLLVVAGEKEGRVGLHQLSVDGAVEEVLHDLSNASVTALVAQPVADHSALPMIMYQANGQAYTFTSGASLIHPEDLADPPDDAGSPPQAPFFLG